VLRFMDGLIRFFIALETKTATPPNHNELLSHITQGNSMEIQARVTEVFFKTTDHFASSERPPQQR
jgi:hypothetical protein